MDLHMGLTVSYMYRLAGWKIVWAFGYRATPLSLLSSSSLSCCRFAWLLQGPHTRVSVLHYY